MLCSLIFYTKQAVPMIHIWFHCKFVPYAVQTQEVKNIKKKNKNKCLTCTRQATHSLLCGKLRGGVTCPVNCTATRSAEWLLAV